MFSFSNLIHQSESSSVKYISFILNWWGLFKVTALSKFCILLFGNVIVFLLDAISLLLFSLPGFQIIVIISNSKICRNWEEIVIFWRGWSFFSVVSNQIGILEPIINVISHQLLHGKNSREFIDHDIFFLKCFAQK